MHHEFLQTLYHWRPLLYALLFLGMIIEGEALLFTAVLLSMRRVLNPYIAFVVSLSGLLIGDFMWYHVGLHLASRLPRISRFVNGATKSFDKLLVRRPFNLIFLSKFIYGIHHAILIKAGSTKMKFSKYAKIIVIADILWYTIIVLAGVVFSESLGALKHYLKYAELLFLVAVVVFIVIERTISMVSERVLEREELDETGA